MFLSARCEQFAKLNLSPGKATGGGEKARGGGRPSTFCAHYALQEGKKWRETERNKKGCRRKKVFKQADARSMRHVAKKVKFPES